LQEFPPVLNDPRKSTGSNHILHVLEAGDPSTRIWLDCGIATSASKKRLRKSKLRRHLALLMPLSRAEISRRWRAAHPEIVKAQKGRYYQKHKARLIESRRCYKRLWRERNRQRLRVQEFELRQKLTADQKARKAAYMLEWRAKHREHIRRYENARHARLRGLHYRQQRARLKRAPESKRVKMREYQRDWMRKWRAVNADRYRARRRRYRAKHRNKELARRRELARLPENKLKAKLGYKRWAQSELGRSYFKERDHRRRARMRFVETASCLVKIRELRKATACHWCGTKLDAITIDHVIPIARGGSHTPDNLVAACLRCNSSKRERLPLEWIRS
jgi:5-methylcytosine-specific restriction endonuclease McrA